MVLLVGLLLAGPACGAEFNPAPEEGPPTPAEDIINSSEDYVDARSRYELRMQAYDQEYLTLRGQQDLADRAFDRQFGDWGPARLADFKHWVETETASGFAKLAEQREALADRARMELAAAPRAFDPPTDSAEMELTVEHWVRELRYAQLRNWALRVRVKATEDYVSHYQAYIGFELSDWLAEMGDDLKRIGWETWSKLYETAWNKCVNENVWRAVYEYGPRALYAGAKGAGRAALTQSLPSVRRPTAEEFAGGAKEFGGVLKKYLKDCVKGTVIDSVVTAVVSGVKQYWVQQQVNQGVYREVAEYWWSEVILPSVKRDMAEEGFRQFGNHLRRQLKDVAKPIALKQAVELQIDKMVKRRLRLLPEELAHWEPFRNATRITVNNSFSEAAREAFKKQAAEDMAKGHFWQIETSMEQRLQEFDAFDFGRKLFGEKLSVYWVNSSDWAQNGPNEIQKFKDIVACLKAQKKDYGPQPVIAVLRLAPDGYMQFMRTCDERGAARDKEIAEAKELLVKVEAIVADLPQNLDHRLIELRAALDGLSHAISDKERALATLRQTPGGRCNVPSPAVAQFDTRRYEAEQGVGELTARHDETLAQRDRACSTLERAVVEESAQLARLAADDVASRAPPLEQALAALIGEARNARDSGGLPGFALDDVRQQHADVTQQFAGRSDDFRSITAVEAELTELIDRGAFLSGRWYDSEARDLLRQFEQHRNAMIRRTNLLADYEQMLQELDWEAIHIEQIDGDHQQALACLDQWYPVAALEQAAAKVPKLNTAADTAAREAAVCRDGFGKHRVDELLAQCKLAEAEAALAEMDPKDPLYNQALAAVTREKSARESLAYARQKWFDRDIGGDYRKYREAYRTLQLAQEPPAPCPETREALASALAEIERLLAEADASSVPARVAAARTALAACEIGQARGKVEPDVPASHAIWTEIAARESGERRARSFASEAAALTGEGASLPQLEAARGKLQAALALDICDTTRAGLERDLAALTAKIAATRVAMGRDSLVHDDIAGARSVVAPLSDDQSGKRDVLAAADNEERIAAEHEAVRSRLGQPGATEDRNTLSSARDTLTTLRGRSVSEPRQAAIDETIAMIDAALGRLGAARDQVAARTALQACDFAGMRAGRDALQANAGALDDAGRSLLAALRREIAADDAFVQSGEAYASGALERTESLLAAAQATNCAARKAEIAERQGKLARLREALAKAKAARTACDVPGMTALRDEFASSGHVLLQRARAALDVALAAAGAAARDNDAAAPLYAAGDLDAAERHLRDAQGALQGGPADVDCAALRNTIAGRLDKIQRMRDALARADAAIAACDLPRLDSLAVQYGARSHVLLTRKAAEMKQARERCAEATAAAKLKPKPPMTQAEASQRCVDRYGTGMVGYRAGGGQWRCRCGDDTIPRQNKKGCIPKTAVVANGERFCASQAQGAVLKTVKGDGDYECRCPADRNYFHKTLRACLTWDQVVADGRTACSAKGQVLVNVVAVDNYTCCPAGTRAYDKANNRCWTWDALVADARNDCGRQGRIPAQINGIDNYVCCPQGTTRFDAAHNTCYDDNAAAQQTIDAIGTVLQGLGNALGGLQNSGGGGGGGGGSSCANPPPGCHCKPGTNQLHCGSERRQ